MITRNVLNQRCIVITWSLWKLYRRHHGLVGNYDRFISVSQTTTDMINLLHLQHCPCFSITGSRKLPNETHHQMLLTISSMIVPHQEQTVYALTEHMWSYTVFVRGSVARYVVFYMNIGLLWYPLIVCFIIFSCFVVDMTSVPI